MRSMSSITFCCCLLWFGSVIQLYEIFLAYLDFIFHFYFIFNDLDQPARWKNIAVFLLCVALSDIWFCYSCSGTLLHDSRSYSALVYLSLCCALCWVCVCALCICQCFFAVINRCQRILFVCFFPVSFVRFIRSFIRLAARSHSFANSRSLSLSLSLCFARAPSLSSTFVLFCVYCLSLTVAAVAAGCCCLPLIAQSILYTLVRSRAILIFTLNIFFARWVLCLALNWIVELILSESDVLILLFYSNCFSSKRFCVFVCTLDTDISIFLFLFVILWRRKKKLRFRYMIIVCVSARISRHQNINRTITRWLGSWRPVFVSWHLYTLMVSRLCQR